jgi:serpin B
MINRRQLLAAAVAAAAVELQLRSSLAQPPSDFLEFQSALDRRGAPPNPLANQFSVELFKLLGDSNKNCIASPLSVLIPLALMVEAAGGSTRSELHAALDLGEEPDSGLRLAEALRRIRSAQTVECRIANALYLQEGNQLQSEFLKLAEGSFQSKVQSVNFRSDPIAVSQRINQWISQQTNDKISGMFGPNSFDPLTSLVLVNAIYFKGTWASQFKPRATLPAPFYLASGEVSQVSMMQRTGRVSYAENELLQRLELDYVGGEFSGVFLLPRPGKSFADLQLQWTAESWKSWSMQSRTGIEVQMSIPKFKVESEFDLKPALQRLGIVDAFIQHKADFTGIFEPDENQGKENVWISKIAQKAFCEVNEEGTEAAAVTAAINSRAPSAPSLPKRFVADRPFLFAIVHRPSGMILFLSRVNDPRKT